MTADVWLPIPPDEIEGLPESLNYLFWDGGEDFPQTGPVRVLRGPLHEARRGLPAPSAPPELRRGRTDPLGRRRQRDAGPRPAASGRAAVQRARGARGERRRTHPHPGPRLAARRPRLRARPGRGEWLGGFRPALADKNVLIVGYGAIGSAIEDRLVPFEVARVARVARSQRTTARGPVHPFTELPSLLPEADIVHPLHAPDREHPAPGEHQLPRPHEGRRAPGQRRPRPPSSTPRPCSPNWKAAASPPPWTSPTPNPCRATRCGRRRVC
ncbi:hypothetical protein SALBM217S_05605 [Streptomyces griseoloalbus]